MNSKKRGSHNRCSIANCSNTSSTFGVSLHSLPKDPAVSKLWLDVVKIKQGKALKQIFICSIHFAPNSFELYVPTSHQTRRTLKKNVVPQFVRREVQIEKFLQDTVHGANQQLQPPQQHLQLHQQLQMLHQHLQPPPQHLQPPHQHWQPSDQQRQLMLQHLQLPHQNSEPGHFSSSTNTSAVGNEGSLEVVEVKEEQVLKETGDNFDVKTESTSFQDENKIDTILFKEEPTFTELDDFNIKTDPTTWENKDNFETTIFVKEEQKLLKLNSFDIKTEPTILNSSNYVEHDYARGGSKICTSVETRLASPSVLCAKRRRLVTSSHGNKV